MFSPNPNAEANLAFDIAKPGQYRLRIEGSTNMPGVSDPIPSKSTPGNMVMKVRLVFADPTAVYTLKDEVAKNLGSIIDNSLVTQPAEKQGKLRSLVESGGIVWADFTDTQMLMGKEVTAVLGVEEYNGDQKNTVKRYLKPQI